jgi:hypothetical protein
MERLRKIVDRELIGSVSLRAAEQAEVTVDLADEIGVLRLDIEMERRRDAQILKERRGGSWTYSRFPVTYNKQFN